MSIIITSQHIDEIEHIADNILYFEDGKAILNCKIFNIGSHQSCFELRSHSVNANIRYELFQSYGLKKTFITNIGQAM